jgi:hypothetical protein
MTIGSGVAGGEEEPTVALAPTGGSDALWLSWLGIAARRMLAKFHATLTREPTRIVEYHFSDSDLNSGIRARWFSGPCEKVLSRRRRRRELTSVQKTSRHNRLGVADLATEWL